MNINSCVGCGCTEEWFCDMGREWVKPRLCSRCWLIYKRVTAQLRRIERSKAFKRGAARAAS